MEELMLLVFAPIWVPVMVLVLGAAFLLGLFKED